MTKAFLIGAALLALSACQGARDLNEGDRLAWRCTSGHDFSLRRVGGSVELYAVGETHRLDPVDGAPGEHRYSNGEITYAESPGAASLTGIRGGPYENCRRQPSDWWFRPW